MHYFLDSAFPVPTSLLRLTRTPRELSAGAPEDCRTRLQAFPNGIPRDRRLAYTPVPQWESITLALCAQAVCLPSIMSSLPCHRAEKRKPGVFSLICWACLNSRSLRNSQKGVAAGSRAGTCKYTRGWKPTSGQRGRLIRHSAARGMRIYSSIFACTASMLLKSTTFRAYGAAISRTHSATASS
jgi:hypothetical protein